MAFNKIEENSAEKEIMEENIQNAFIKGLEIGNQQILEERWRIWAELCKHFPKGTDENELIHKIVFSA